MLGSVCEISLGIISFFFQHIRIELGRSDTKMLFEPDDEIAVRAEAKLNRDLRHQFVAVKQHLCCVAKTDILNELTRTASCYVLQLGVESCLAYV